MDKKEHILSIPEAAKQNKVAPVTVYRWINFGARAVDGRRITLETFRSTSGLKTSLEAMERFYQRLNERHDVRGEPSVNQRRDAVKRRLEAAGFKSKT